jgi:hypothetical protein
LLEHRGVRVAARFDPSAIVGRESKGSLRSRTSSPDSTFVPSWDALDEHRRTLRTSSTMAGPSRALRGARQYEDKSFAYDTRTSGAAVVTTTSQNSATTATYNDELDVTRRTGEAQRLPYDVNEVFQRDPAGRIAQVSHLDVHERQGWGAVQRFIVRVVNAP